eukprot:1419767-Alexandrium_andersonii.AAC.1
MWPSCKRPWKRCGTTTSSRTLRSTSPTPSTPTTQTQRHPGCRRRAVFKCSAVPSPNLRNLHGFGPEPQSHDPQRFDPVTIIVSDAFRATCLPARRPSPRSPTKPRCA